MVKYSSNPPKMPSKTHQPAPKWIAKEDYKLSTKYN